MNGGKSQSMPEFDLDWSPTFEKTGPYRHSPSDLALFFIRHGNGDDLWDMPGILSKID
jgi:hypothetical protein